MCLTAAAFPERRRIDDNRPRSGRGLGSDVLPTVECATTRRRPLLIAGIVGRVVLG